MYKDLIQGRVGSSTPTASFQLMVWFKQIQETPTGILMWWSYQNCLFMIHPVSHRRCNHIYFAVCTHSWIEEAHIEIVLKKIVQWKTNRREIVMHICVKKKRCWGTVLYTYLFSSLASPGVWCGASMRKAGIQNVSQGHKNAVSNTTQHFIYYY